MTLSGQLASGTNPDIVQITGDPLLAEVIVLRSRGDDRFCLECVDGLDSRYPRHEKWIINVSTQFGCPVRCSFCDAGGEFHGNPNAAEIATQIRYIASRHSSDVLRCRKLKVHFARMGEPSLNESVLTCIERLPEILPAPGLWCCVATMAPRSGLDWMNALIDIKKMRFHRRFQLQFSLNTTDEDVRRTLYQLPVLSFDEIREFGLRFFQPGDRKIVLNFALSQDWPFQASRIIDRFSPDCFAVKLTPLNPTWTGETNGLQTVIGSTLDAEAFLQADMLRKRNFDVILSINDKRENEVLSNCGQAVRTIRTHPCTH